MTTVVPKRMHLPVFNIVYLTSLFFTLPLGLPAHADDVAASAGNSSLPAEAADGNETSGAPLWLDCYADGGNEPNENNNLYGYSEIKIGKRLGLPLPVDIYGKVRIEADGAGYFWHNHVDAGIGTRLHILTGKASLFVFAEGAAGRYTTGNKIMRQSASTQDQVTVLQNNIDRTWEAYQNLFEKSINIKYGIGDPAQVLGPIDSMKTALFALQSYIDTMTQERDSLQQVTDSIMQIPTDDLVELRGGLVFWKGWGLAERPPSKLGFPFRFWGDLYGEMIFVSSQKKIHTRDLSSSMYVPASSRYINTICSLSPKLGTVVSEGPAGSLIAYTGGDLVVDVRGDWYNNKTSVEAGLRYAPFHAIDLLVNAEYVLGSYLGRQRLDDENPNKQVFHDFRVQVCFWYGLGF